jgi:hypothetical protein
MTGKDRQQNQNSKDMLLCHMSPLGPSDLIVQQLKNALNILNYHSGNVKPPFIPLDIQHTFITFVKMKEMLT